MVPRGVAATCHRLLDYGDILVPRDLTACSKGANPRGVLAGVTIIRCSPSRAGENARKRYVTGHNRGREDKDGGEREKGRIVQMRRRIEEN